VNHCAGKSTLAICFATLAGISFDFPSLSLYRSGDTGYIEMRSLQPGGNESNFPAAIIPDQCLLAVSELSAVGSDFGQSNAGAPVVQWPVVDDRFVDSRHKKRRMQYGSTNNPDPRHPPLNTGADSKYRCHVFGRLDRRS
jgi:hypothetical protein